MVKYHTDQDITIKCLEHRAYPMAVVQEMLKIEPKKNIINGILNVTPDGIQPPKSIMTMANALGYSNPEIDSKVYGAGEVSRIRRKLDPQQIMENTNVRGAMIPPRLSSQSKLEIEMMKRTKKLQSDLMEDSKVNRDLDIKERIKQAEMSENLLMSGEDYKNPGEKGFTFSVGMNTMTSLSQPSLFEPSKKQRQKIIIKKATTAAGMAGGKIPESTPEINEIISVKRPRGRAPKGKVWDANRGQYVIDPYAKAVTETKMTFEEREQVKAANEMKKMQSEDINVEALLSKDAAMSPASTDYYSLPPSA